MLLSLVSALGISVAAAGEVTEVTKTVEFSSLAENTDMSAHDIAEKSLHIAASICVYTNHNVIVEDV